MFDESAQRPFPDRTDLGEDCARSRPRAMTERMESAFSEPDGLWRPRWRGGPVVDAWGTEAEATGQDIIDPRDTRRLLCEFVEEAQPRSWGRSSARPASPISPERLRSVAATRGQERLVEEINLLVSQLPNLRGQANERTDEAGARPGRAVGRVEEFR